MKKVAATSGHKVSLAAFFLALGMTWEGNCAGTEMLLNLYSRPPKRRSPSRATLSIPPFQRAREASWLLKNTRSALPCNKKMHRSESFSGCRRRPLSAVRFCLRARTRRPSPDRPLPVLHFARLSALIFLCWSVLDAFFLPVLSPGFFPGARDGFSLAFAAAASAVADCDFRPFRAA